MSHFLPSADRNTHLKIVAVSLVAAVVLIAVGLNVRTTGSDPATVRADMSGPVIKAGKPASLTRVDGFTAR